MLEKEYYRLDELTAFGIYEGTIRYFIEQNRLQPAFYLLKSRVVLGCYIQNKFNGFAVAEYQGLVSIPAFKSIDLLQKGRTQSSVFGLLQSEKITLCSNDYPFNIPCPNSYIESWLDHNPTRSDWQFVPAKIYPHEHDTGWSILENALNIFSGTEGYLKKFDGQSLSEKPKRALGTVGVDLLLSQICVRHDDLLSLGLISFERKQPPTAKSNLTEEVQELLKFKNEFEELVSRVIVAQPNMSAKKVFRILCNETKREEDSRLFDRENILLDEVDGRLIWRDKLRRSSDQERRVSLGYFCNMIKDIKSKIK